MVAERNSRKKGYRLYSQVKKKMKKARKHKTKTNMMIINGLVYTVHCTFQFSVFPFVLFLNNGQSYKIKPRIKPKYKHGKHELCMAQVLGLFE